MNRDLAQLLQEAVPEPPSRLDPDDIRRRAARGSAARRWAGPALAVAVFVGAIGVAGPRLPTRWPSASSVTDATDATGAARASDETGSTGATGATRVADLADVPLTLSVLQHRVPLPETAAGAVADAELVYPGEGSLAGTVGDEQIYLVEATGDRLCLIAVNELTGAGGSNGCVPRTDLLDPGVTLDYGMGEVTYWRFIVAAPDAYTLATAGGTSAPIVSNVAAIDLDTTGTELTISGPGVPSVTFTVGIPGSIYDDAPRSREHIARTELAELARLAQVYNRKHGSTAGYADVVNADSTPVTRRLIPSVTDTTATADLGSGSCLTVDLLSGRIRPATC